MKKKRDYDGLVRQYMLIFDESFPDYMIPGDEEEQMDIIERCLREKKPYDPRAEWDVKPDVDY